jgi:hypothetical protein
LVAPAGVATDVSVQLAPFQRSTNEPATDGSDAGVASLPVARQSEGLGHETPVSHARDADAGTGTETSAQVLPFQRSTRGLSGPDPCAPTAKQLEASEQLRPSTEPTENPLGIWIGTRRRALPSHRSAYNARAGPPKPGRPGPTVRHVVGDGHAMAPKIALGGLGGFGLLTSDQAGAALAAVAPPISAAHATAAARTSFAARAPERTLRA